MTNETSNIEKLLEEAKTKYANASKIKSAQSGRIFDIIPSNKIRLNNSNNIVFENSTHAPYLYYNGKWADIVEYREPVINTNYNIF